MHIHTVLSPCADLEMSPDVILAEAIKQRIDIIAITDHNSTLQVATVKRMAEGMNISVFGGVEVNTKEEVHALAYFGNDDALNAFQTYIDQHLPVVENKPELFGDQVVVNEKNEIVYEEKRLLINALNVGLDQVEKKVHALGGIFIPAHVGRKANGIVSQLGMIPDDLSCDALEVTSTNNMRNLKLRFGRNNDVVWVSNSDAHYPGQIGRGTTDFMLESPDFEEFRMALQERRGRHVVNLRMKA